jgi:hypothetical protein
MHRFAAVAAVGIFVASCAGTIKEGMTRLQGQPLSAVITKIGVPNDERTVATVSLPFGRLLELLSFGVAPSPYGTCPLHAPWD